MKQKNAKLALTKEQWSPLSDLTASNKPGPENAATFHDLHMDLNGFFSIHE